MNFTQIFDYKTLRLIMGLIAISLPVVATEFYTSSPSSISASYYSDTRDFFVGMLFIIGTLLFAYNGKSKGELFTSKFAAIFAFLVAIFPTACDTCTDDTKSVIHYVSAVLLFAILAYYCLGPFYSRAKAKGDMGIIRSYIYLGCGIIMVICLAGILILKFTLTTEVFNGYSITYWGETISLFVFGFSWLVAAQIIVIEKEQRHKLFKF